MNELILIFFNIFSKKYFSVLIIRFTKYVRLEKQVTQLTLIKIIKVRVVETDFLKILKLLFWDEPRIDLST